MFDRENVYYNTHKQEFHEKFPDKWLIIVEDSLYGVYDTIAEATKAALLQFKPGEFMMRRPIDDDLVIEVGPIIRTRYTCENKTKPISKIKYIEGEPLIITYA